MTVFSDIEKDVLDSHIHWSRSTGHPMSERWWTPLASDDLPQCIRDALGAREIMPFER